MKKWIDNSKANRLAMLQRAEDKFGINQVAIEKDWWVTAVLNALFRCDCAPALIFKGGTSLSKAWNLIERFSEDVDLSIDRSFFGITQTNKNQRDKLRKVARKYIHETLAQELEARLHEMGVTGFTIECVTTVTANDGTTRPIDSDKDPTVILVHYKSILGTSISYIPPRVKIEISCLSMNEPTEIRTISSLIEQTFAGEDNALTVAVPTVYPTRTFLEKAFLLCEEFQKHNPRYIRMSRHLYDLERLMDTEFGTEALTDVRLYEQVVTHRSIFYSLKYVDYSRLLPQVISFIPPAEVVGQWRGDYAEMRSHFIYGNALDFDELLKRIQELQSRFRNIVSNYQESPHKE